LEPFHKILPKYHRSSHMSELHLRKYFLSRSLK